MVPILNTAALFYIITVQVHVLQTLEYWLDILHANIEIIICIMYTLITRLLYFKLTDLAFNTTKHIKHIIIEMIVNLVMIYGYKACLFLNLEKRLYIYTSVVLYRLSSVTFIIYFKKNFLLYYFLFQ